MCVASVLAIMRAWLTDDAFISFRYARNLIEGHGLVYNPGERVEGYSNFLWTLWCAFGLWVRIPAEVWAQIWGVVFYAASIGLLTAHLMELRPQAGPIYLAIPVTALMAVLHEDWSIYATGGLETSAFTFLALCGYILLVRKPSGNIRLSALAGAVMALATLTRPDGAVFALVGGLFLLAWDRPRLKSALVYAAGFAVLLVPVQTWRICYYGDFFPNTYYAKSAYLPWWDQGWHYAKLYFLKYWPLLFGIFGIILAAIPGLARSAREKPLLMRSLSLAAGFSLAYTSAIARIGGDFMFARLLIPATPFYLILTSLGLVLLSGLRPWISLYAGLLLVAGMGLALLQTTLPSAQRGVANEWRHRHSRIEHHPEKPTLNEYLDHRAEVLKRYLSDLPVRVAFLGDEARVMYKARIPVAIESTTGLTDRFIARQKLEKRRWVGHEKPAPEEYLAKVRKVHFTFSPQAPSYLGIGKITAPLRIKLEDVSGYILYWDPEIMEELERRGARFEDVRYLLDKYIEHIQEIPVETVVRDYTRFRCLYFDHVEDPSREKAFRDNLNNPNP
jgi:hypothetical protein